MIVVDRSAIETRLQEKGLKKQAFLANSSPREGEAPAEPQVLFDVARRLRFGRSLTLTRCRICQKRLLFKTPFLQSRFDRGAINDYHAPCYSH